MADVAWLLRRLKAMSIPEVMWRLSQKSIQRIEKNRFKVQKVAVTSSLFNSKLKSLQIDADKMHLNLTNTDYTLETSIPLLGGYDYQIYKKKWNAGFQTAQEWPLEFSYSLEYKQRDDIGDARTNWELNRHFQFAILAKDYRASGDIKYLSELIDLFEDWNKENHFLWVISWTSVMEVAIRCSNWCYMYCFLDGLPGTEKIQEELRIGILNMADYIANHYSRYSSANNHLIVEAYAIGQSGILCSYEPWIALAISILTRELPRQNYSDGINKELSLHYQSFYMEAMGLMMRLLIKNRRKVSASWGTMLDKMCSYVANCIGDYGEVVVFGDDDEGKILDLHGGVNHYQYVLGLFSLLMNTQYVKLDRIACENLCWLFAEEDWQQSYKNAVYKPPLSVCYEEGGNTLLRSNDRRILIGIDHAALGFGSIAAHGHADALSFQMYVEGKSVFVDPGTYIYHCDLESRNSFRRTENHSTVCVDEKNQSEMLGAFLWGKKAESKLLEYTEIPEKIVLKAAHNGYAPIKVERTFVFDREKRLVIVDQIMGACTFTKNLIVDSGIQIKQCNNHTVEMNLEDKTILVSFACESHDIEVKTMEIDISKYYGTKERGAAIRLQCAMQNQVEILTKIEIR